MQMFNGITSRTLNFCRARYDEPEKVGENQDSMKEKYDKIMKELDEVKTGENADKKKIELKNDILNEGFSNFLLDNPKLLGDIMNGVKYINSGVKGTKDEAGKQLDDINNYIQQIPKNLSLLTDDWANTIGINYHDVYLDSISKLTVDQAKALRGKNILREGKKRIISLNGLTDFDSSVAAALTRETSDIGSKGFEEIHLDGLKKIDAQALSVLTDEGCGISLCGLESIQSIRRDDVDKGSISSTIWLDEKFKDEVEDMKTKGYNFGKIKFKFNRVK